jgi:hypothetical protein
MVGREMFSPIIIIKERPIGLIDIITIPVASGILTIIDMDIIPTHTVIIGTLIPIMAVTGGPGSFLMMGAFGPLH